ncbi:methyltransferase domain-containing protein [Colletotrichum incanum]|uniref:Methyltransferase domain-containing protein n=1 Tax=Colletotrichum incanum TaxID=1573173 RepID=A0A167A0P3_COLIC|nr:methyltransferase domain-containing protein [Colletotrichum incanum]
MPSGLRHGITNFVTVLRSTVPIEFLMSELGQAFGRWTMVVGVDLSAIQPGFFEVDDIEKEWTWSEPFDFIFFRSMISSFTRWPDIIAKAYKNLEPGGYLELQDNMFPLQCQDGPMPDDFIPYKWSKLLVEGTNKIGRPITVAASFKQMLENAGFIDVEERREKWPFNPWPKDKKLNDLGAWSQASTMMGVEAVSMALFTRVLDWSPEEATVFCAEVRNAHKKIGVHAYYDVYAAWGRKPEKDDEKDEADQS